ncbi:glycosyltransferase [Escherichia coli]|nr:glycosyltransferase [Escherichia coli]EHC4233757.1 glycosyltransferase [Escherichia coli]HBE5646886.1 glycosyltransferase [Escherichia coli]HDX8501350.1 glycosyltransferase [Escherichia coli]
MSEKESIAVSVIIPVHNAAGYISDTLSTVLSQTLNDIEIIIVNDCSDDNTLGKVRISRSFLPKQTR